MKKRILDCQLPLLVSLTADERIKKVELSLHPQGFACQIFGNPPSKFLKKIFNFLEGYASKQAGILPPLDMSSLPPFTLKVLHHLTEIPLGKTQTYGQVAETLSTPKAYRAVGGACGRNPFPLFIPCHRVLSPNSLGGYSGGLQIKKILLDFERMP
jgi:methylated-DNA-[protein]-cysteine S-methyltransferase